MLFDLEESYKGHKYKTQTKYWFRAMLKDKRVLPTHIMTSEQIQIQHLLAIN